MDSVLGDFVEKSDWKREIRRKGNEAEVSFEGHLISHDGLSVLCYVTSDPLTCFQTDHKSVIWWKQEHPVQE